MARVNYDSTPVKQFLNIYFNYLTSLPEKASQHLISNIHQAHLNSLPIEMRDRIKSTLYTSANPTFIKNFTSMAIYNLGCKGDIETLEIPSHLIDIFADTFKVNLRATPKKQNIAPPNNELIEQAKIREKAKQLQEIKNQSKINRTISSSSVISSAEELIPTNWTKDDLRRSFLMSEIIRLPRCKRKKIR